MSTEAPLDHQLLATDKDPMTVKDESFDGEFSDDDLTEIPIAKAPPTKEAVEKTLGTDFLKHLEHMNVVLDALPKDGARFLYRAQAIHNPTCLTGEPTPPKIPVYITEKVSQPWRKNAMQAISNIRLAAPGINIYVADTQDEAAILIDNVESEESNDANTTNDIWEENEVVLIHLGDSYARTIAQEDMELFQPGTTQEEAEEKTMLATCTHELFHALGFDHEHQTRCNAKQLDASKAGYPHSQVKVLNSAINLTRFDRHSIMLYPELTCKTTGSSTAYNLVMSELDKVTLNMIFPPRKRSLPEAYNPQEFECAGTNMFYCFRNVMESHNNPYSKISNGICGGDRSKPSGPNCPACRTLKCERSFLNDVTVSRWQGWSGMIYCGGNNHPCNHLCGPDTGYPCYECKALIDPQ